jgi:hypothetical protein
MRKLLVTTGLACLLTNGFSQNQKPCGTDQVMNEWFSNHPEIKSDFEKRQLQLEAEDAIAFAQGYQQKTAAAPAYTIPIVFHILHTNGSENISDAQVIDAVNILNRDYRKQNADTAQVVNPFKSMIADVNVEFVLATKDPAGNCTNGITHHYNVKTNWTGASSDYIYTWTPSKYLNIYVVKTIGSGAAGYTYLPGSVGSIMDAIVILHDYVGSIGTGNPFTSRALTHEVGHWLNLPHTWGSTNNPGVACGNDGVGDTPLTKGFTSCPSSTTAAQICNAGVTENYQNYMDYSYCSKMFTPGQATRMTTCLNSATAGRNNLWTSANLLATGVTSPLTPCAPIADFHNTYNSAPNVYTVCSGQAVNFYDDSYNGTVTSRTWAATGASTISNTGGSPTSITFSSAGTETVSLMVSNSTGTSIATKTISVLPGTAFITGIYQESFETLGLPSNWNVINTSGVQWDQYLGMGASGTACYWIDGTTNAPGQVDILQTPSYDFLNNSGASFSFKYAYAKYNSSNADVFKIQVSSNCGGSWTDITMPANSTLASGSGGVTTAPFTPSSTAQFKTYTLTAHPAFNTFKTQSNVIIRFHFKEDPTTGYGNNFYLDDINFNLPLGVNELTQSIGFDVSPNPSAGAVSINFRLSDPSDIRYSVMDVTGRTVEKELALQMHPGIHHLTVNEGAHLSPGIYFVNFRMNGQQISRKIIIE